MFFYELSLGIIVKLFITFVPCIVFLTSECMQRKRRSRRSGSHSTQLRDGNLQSIFGGSSIAPSSNSSPDPLLSSFILPMVDDSVSAKPKPSSETNTAKKNSDVDKSER